MHELARPVAADLRHHHGQQRVGGDVERHAEEDIGAALVELATELAVGDVELEQRVAGRQLHLRHVARIPGRDDVAARVGILLKTFDEFGDLVDFLAVLRGPVSPLVAVNRPEVAVLVGPFVPDRDLVVLQPADVGVAAQKPEQLDDDGAQVQLLGGQRREAGGEVEAHLPAEHRARAGAGAVGFDVPVVEHVAHEVEVLAHEKGRRQGCL